MSMYIFLDTNIYLDLYELSDDDLAQLEQLETLLHEKPAILLIPEQVQDEFARNREGQIKSSLTHLKKKKIDSSFPRLCSDYPEYDDLVGIISKFEQKRNALIEKISADAANSKLKADKLIHNLFAFGKKLLVTNEIMKAARDRHDKGNPPGKRNSLGDAINWECVLKHFDNGTDNEEINFFIISGDGDFTSTLKNSQLSHFLLEEWGKKFNTDISFFPKLIDFFADQFPEIKLSPSTLERHLVVESFVNSESFSKTHSVIRKLNQFQKFEVNEINRMMEAALTNNQISMIADDDDVNDFLRKLASGYGVDANQKLADELLQLTLQ